MIWVCLYGYARRWLLPKWRLIFLYLGFMGGSSLVYGTVLKVPVLPLLKGQRENRGHYITGLYSNGHEGRRVRFEVPCLCLFFSFFFENHFLVIESGEKLGVGKVPLFEHLVLNFSASLFTRYLYLFFLFQSIVCLYFYLFYLFG